MIGTVLMVAMVVMEYQHRSIRFNERGSKTPVGEQVFIFRKSGSPGNFKGAKNQRNISGTETFTTHGTWQFTLTDEKDTNMVTFEKYLTL